jgi:hypothetical protein
MAIQLDLASSQYGTPFAGAYFRIATASHLMTTLVKLTFVVTMLTFL